MREMMGKNVSFHMSFFVFCVYIQYLARVNTKKEKEEKIKDEINLQNE